MIRSCCVAHFLHKFPIPSLYLCTLLSIFTILQLIFCPYVPYSNFYHHIVTIWFVNLSQECSKFLSSLSFGFSLKESPQQVIPLLLTLSSTSFSILPTALMSHSTTSMNILLCLPLVLCPSSSGLRTFLQHFYSSFSHSVQAILICLLCIYLK